MPDQHNSRSPAATSLRTLSVLVIVGYVWLTGYFLVRQVLGDTSAGPVAYFFTWDMFPNYPTESSRRLAVGVTARGGYVRLFPNPHHRFRWGVKGDLTRLDLNRRLRHFRRAAQDAAGSYQPADPNDRLVRLYLVERYWPVTFNLPEELYRKQKAGFVEESTGGKPQRSYWRILETADVSAEGTVEDWETLP